MAVRGKDWGNEKLRASYIYMKHYIAFALGTYTLRFYFRYQVVSTISSFHRESNKF